jgi:hypothetical protein
MRGPAHKGQWAEGGFLLAGSPALSGLRSPVGPAGVPALAQRLPDKARPGSRHSKKPPPDKLSEAGRATYRIETCMPVMECVVSCPVCVDGLRAAEASRERETDGDLEVVSFATRDRPGQRVGCWIAKDRPFPR